MTAIYLNEELLSTLYNRHAAALSVVAQDSNERVHIDAARMALALMARELADKLYSAQHDDDASINLVVVRQVEQLLKQYAADLYEQLVLGEFTTVDQPLAVLLERNNQALQSINDLCNEEFMFRQNAEHRIVELDAENARLRTELAAAIDERNFADTRCAELEQQLAQLAAERDELRADLADLRDATVEFSRDIGEIIAERDALRQQLVQLDADNAALIQRNGNGKSTPAAAAEAIAWNC